MPKVIHCKRDKSDNVVYVGRPTKWGNPFVIGKDGNRDEVIEKYYNWLITQKDLLKDLHELKSKDLSCWCSPEPCHADILLVMAGLKYPPGTPDCAIRGFNPNTDF